MQAKHESCELQVENTKGFIYFLLCLGLDESLDLEIASDAFLNELPLWISADLSIW